MTGLEWENFEKYDSKEYIVEQNSEFIKYYEEKEIAVQVNGKVRATIKINVNEDEESIKEKALKEENVKNHTDGKEIVKIIVIKGKIVNIVVK